MLLQSHPLFLLLQPYSLIYVTTTLSSFPDVAKTSSPMHYVYKTSSCITLWYYVQPHPLFLIAKPRPLVSSVTTSSSIPYCYNLVLWYLLLQPHPLIFMLLQPYPLFLMWLQPRPLYIMFIQPHPILLSGATTSSSIPFSMFLQPRPLCAMLVQPRR